MWNNVVLYTTKKYAAIGCVRKKGRCVLNHMSQLRYYKDTEDVMYIYGRLGRPGRLCRQSQ